MTFYDDDLTFDEMVEQLRIHGDHFKSVIATANGFQANAESRYGGNAYACDTGKTPTEALANLCRQRCGVKAPEPVKTLEMDDII